MTSSIHPLKSPVFFNFLHRRLSARSAVQLCPLRPPDNSGCDSAGQRLRVHVASRRRDWPWLGPLRPHSSSWQERSWELFNSRRIGGSASHRYPPVHRHTHTCACAHHTTAQPGRLCVSASDKTSLLPESTLHGHERCCGPQPLPNIQSSVGPGKRRREMYESEPSFSPRYCKNAHICIVN